MEVLSAAVRNFHDLRLAASIKGLTERLAEIRFYTPRSIIDEGNCVN